MSSCKQSTPRLSFRPREHKYACAPFIVVSQGVAVVCGMDERFVCRELAGEVHIEDSTRRMISSLAVRQDKERFVVLREAFQFLLETERNIIARRTH